MLSDLEADGRNLLQIILAGQPMLEENLSRPGGDALRQRIAVRCRLGSLSAEETESYIRHRVSVAGGDSDFLFTGESCQAIHRFAHGIPREINLLAGEALMLAHTAGESAIEAGHVAGAAVLLGFHSVVQDSQPTGGAAKPVAVETVEVVPCADADLDPGECEAPAMGLCGLPDVFLPASCEAPLAGHAGEPTLADLVTSAPVPPEVAPASRPPESPVVEIQSFLPAPSGIPPSAPARPVGPAAKATPAWLESPEVDAWLARFRDPAGPPRIGSRLAVATTVSEALEHRTAGAGDEPPALPALPPQAGARRRVLPRRRGSRRGHLWRSASWVAGALLLLAAGGVMLATSGRSLVRVRPSTRAAVEATVRKVDRTRTLSASVARPSLVSAPPTAAPTRSPAQAASASSPAAAAARPPAQAASASSPAASATRPAPAPPARRYGVEVATFIVERRAVEERDRLAARISLPCSIAISFEDGAQVYGIVVGPVASPEEAVRLSEDLSARRVVGQARVVRWAASDSTRR